MTLTVLDSSNIDAIVADAKGETIEGTAVVVDDKTAKADDKADDKEVKADAKTDGETDPDDVEGEDGHTPRQKRELSATMLKAIGKKHRQMKEAEEFAAAQYSEKQLAEQRAQLLEQELAALKGKPQEAVKELKEPDRADFATDPEYIAAMVKFGVDNALKEKAAADAKAASERAYQEMEAAAKQRIKKAMELVPDFADVTGAADATVPPVVAGYMQKSEMFAELGYHLAKHPDIVVSLTKLAPDEQLVKIGKIEATLKPFSESTTDSGHDGKSSKAAPEAKQASEITGTIPSKARNTAPVIQPLNTNGAVVERDPANMNIRETIADWTKRQGVNLALRKRH